MLYISGNPTRAVVAVLCLMAMTSSAESQAETESSIPSPSPIRLDLIASYDPFSGFSGGQGLWVSYPLLTGMIPTLKEVLYLEGGMVLTFNRERVSGLRCSEQWFAWTPMAGVRWDVTASDSWTVFAVAKVGINDNFNRTTNCVAFVPETNFSEVSFALDAGAGAYYHLSRGMALRFSFSTQGFMAGLGWRF